MERVALFGGRGQAVVKQYGNQTLDLSRRLLAAEIKITIVLKRFTENKRGLVVGVDQSLMQGNTDTLQLRRAVSQNILCLIQDSGNINQFNTTLTQILCHVKAGHPVEFCY